MGTDVHAILQVKIDNKWETKEVLDLGRNYLLFAILANVRNGYGFAGVPTHTPIIPIAMPKGLPDDLELIDGEYVPIWNRYNEYLETKTWLGDHSHSWLTLKEINEYNWEQKTTRCGFIEPETAKNTPHGTQPESWCGGTNNENYEFRQWEITIKEEVTKEIFYIIEAYEQHFDLNNVRIVFGFDS